jgi:hypothetical protein
MPTPPTPIDSASPLPPRGDDTFPTLVDAFVSWLIAAVDKFNALATNVFNNAAETYNNAQSAQASATAAATAANAALWVSGTNYALDVCVISPLDRQTYRRIVAGAGTTDPKLDNTNWTRISGTPRSKLHAIALYF